MTELTYAALRQIMYQPSAVWLATENSGDRWLHDQWVMLNVTGHPALEATHGVGEKPDGAYKLMADSDKGLQPRDSIPPADLEAYFAGITGAWVPCVPSDWSVAEHPGKAMLWVAQGKPCLLGETTWTAIKRHFPDCSVKYLSGRNLFMFAHFDPRSGFTPFCYAAGIQVPDGQEAIADEIARLVPLTQLATTSNLEAKSTSNEE